MYQVFYVVWSTLAFAKIVLGYEVGYSTFYETTKLPANNEDCLAKNAAITNELNRLEDIRENAHFPEKCPDLRTTSGETYNENPLIRPPMKDCSENLGGVIQAILPQLKTCHNHSSILSFLDSEQVQTLLSCALKPAESCEENPSGPCPKPLSVSCGPNERICDGGFDSKGCRLPATCISKTAKIEINGIQCPGQCPVNCQPGMKKCPPLFDGNGCPQERKCIQEKLAGSECEQHCLVQCAGNQMQCHGGIDERGCPLPPICLPTTEIIHKSDQTVVHCRTQCPIFCGQNEQKCPNYKDKSGCPREGPCLPRDMSGCPSICPLECESNQMTCPTGFDGNNCKKPDICVPISFETGKNGLRCPQFCPPLNCSGQGQWSSGELDPLTGCRGEPKCI